MKNSWFSGDLEVSVRSVFTFFFILFPDDQGNALELN